MFEDNIDRDFTNSITHSVSPVSGRRLDPNPPVLVGFSPDGIGLYLFQRSYNLHVAK